MELSQEDAQHIPWNEYIHDKLLSKASCLTGVALLAKEGLCVYNYGKLGNDANQDWSIFIQAFSNTDKNLPQTKFSLLVDSEKIDFIPFKSSLASVYGVCAGDRYRLMACSFSLGVLVCVSEPPTPMSCAVKAVEEFCANLKT